MKPVHGKTNKLNDKLSHIDLSGRAHMVDVSGKSVTRRLATAQAIVTVGKELANILRTSGAVAKGNVLETARLAGIMAAKRTAELIPMCHSLVVDAVDIKAEVVDDTVVITTKVSCEGKTGVEMEAMTAASVAALTVYDMVKSAQKGVQIGPIRLLEKTGGKSGAWKRQDDNYAKG